MWYFISSLCSILIAKALWDHRHRENYPIRTMCQFFAVSRSRYYDFVKRSDLPCKDTELVKEIRTCQQSNGRTYGYQRVLLRLKKKDICRNSKTILHIMRKYDLLSEIHRHRKWIHMGQQLHKYENLLNRDFNADHPNRKWVTDISYIHTKQSVLYPSMIQDLYDRSIVAYKTGTGQTVNLILDAIRLAMKEKKKIAGELQLHSDQGA